eukprot:784180-Pleurochrysis_carterae.AAC.1
MTCCISNAHAFSNVELDMSAHIQNTLSYASGHGEHWQTGDSEEWWTCYAHAPSRPPPHHFRFRAKCESLVKKHGANSSLSAS